MAAPLVVPDEHVKLKNELLYLAQKQRSRIDKLKADSQVQLERYAGGKRKELTVRRDRTKAAIQELQPELERVRKEWQRLKLEDSEHEGRYAKLSDHYRSTQARLKVLQEAIAGAYQGTGDGKQDVSGIRERLAEISKDKAELRAKLMRAWDCLSIDENMLNSRVVEEQAYGQRVKEMLRAVESEVAGQEIDTAQHQDRADDVLLINSQLSAMKQKTNELQDAYVMSLQTRRDLSEEFLLEAMRAMQELTHNQTLLTIKSHAIRDLQSKVEYLRKQFQPQTQAQTPAKEIWFRNKLEVMDNMLTEMSQIKEHYQVRSEDKQILKETTNHCNKAKAELHAIEKRVEGPDKYRKKLIDEITDMRHLLDEKLEEEDRLVAQLDGMLAAMGEDIGHIRELVDRQGFDDYVSSDSDPNADEVFIRLDEEGTGDVDIITTSLDYHADDPAGSEAVQRFGHRQQGPLHAFEEARAAQLASRPQRKLGDRVRKPRGKEQTPETRLMAVQEQAVTEVVMHLRNREDAIQRGAYDTRMDVIVPDPVQASRNSKIQHEVEIWKEEQRGGARYRTESNRPPPDTQGVHQPEPTDAALQAGTNNDIAVQYLQRMVHGFVAMMFFNGPGGPHPRHIFMTKDLKRLAWRLPQRDGENMDDDYIAMADIKAVVTGHRTGVFKQHKDAGRVVREAAALSIVTHQQTSLDLELDTTEERDYWAQILSKVASEMRPGGIINAVIASGVVQVTDYSAPEHRSLIDEPYDRKQVQLRVNLAGANH
eukprot:TRINITY_DN12074_c0_g1_i1.p1 TRINITY_DN12074_c0_g1~~TRINITY_DN12074_c0_g1_i1.p1  ORF type:complete len:764 (+),score=348.91 TRINITY_DN12074_c0_g1_i1:1357-3648(+)